MRAVVKGRVQGVGFRITARNYAARLGLAGSVRNLPDGSVEIIAVGKRTAIDNLLNAVRDNAIAGDVSAVFSEEIDVKNSFEGFSIL